MDVRCESCQTVYEFDDAMKPRGRRYLGDPEAVAKAMHAVVSQGKAK